MHLHIISPISPDKFKNSNLASNRLRLDFLYNAALQLGFRVTGGLNIPDFADIYYVGKITKEIEAKDIIDIINKLNKKKTNILVDYTDDWLDASHGRNKEIYEKIMRTESTVIVPIKGLQDKLNKIGKKTIVIPDGIDTIPNIDPKSHKNHVRNVLWHGHSSNINSLIRIISTELADYKFNLNLVSNSNAFEIIKKTNFKTQPKCNITGHIWSLDKLQSISKKCDFAILPVNKKWASANRLITTFRLGLPVIVETISSYSEYSDYYSNFKKNQIIEMFSSPEKWHKSIKLAQKKILKDFAPTRLYDLWKNCLKNNNNH